MIGKFLKVALICVAIIAMGVSFRTLVSKGTFSCATADVAQDTANTETPLRAEAPSPNVPPEGETAADLALTAPQGTDGADYDFSDLSSWNLTVSAWEHMAAKDYVGAFAYARKCLELHEAKAREAARTMRKFASAGHEDDFAVVNDVATAHYIMGEAYMKQGKNDEALKEFELVIAEYPYAQCWDPKGWFWKVADVSKKNIEKIGKLK